MAKSDYKQEGRAARSGGSGFSGVAAAAGAMGKALGIFKKIPIPRVKGKKKSTSWRLKSADLPQNVLEIEIARLEKKLDDIYSRVVQGAGSLRREEATTESLDLESLMDLARDLKEQLRKKRSELSRNKREEARLSRLKQSGWQGALPPTTKELVARAPDKRAPTPVSTGISEKMRRAILKASTRPAFKDSAEQVIFEKVVGDMLDDDPETRQTAATRLGELNPKAASGILTIALEDPESRVRIAALNALALADDESATPLFLKFARSEDHRFRIAALRGLARTQGEKINQALLMGLEDEVHSVRKAAATYMGWRKSKEATKALIRAIRDDQEEVRAAAATSLGSIRDDRSVLYLIRALVDSALSVREAAKKSLSKLLGIEIEVDVTSEGEHLDSRVEELKKWWRTARVDRHFDKEYPDTQVRPPAPGEPVVGKPTAEEIKEEAAKVVDLKAASESRAKEETAPQPAALEAAPESKPVAAEAKVEKALDQGPDAGLDTGLEDLGLAASESGESEGLDAGVDGGLETGFDDGLAGLGISAGDGETGGLDEGLGSGLDEGLGSGLDAGLEGLGITGDGESGGLDGGLDVGLDAGLGDLGLSVTESDKGASKGDKKD